MGKATLEQHSMDSKEQFLIREIHSAIVSGSFDERDILALLILLRRHYKKGTPILEFGDFVAHRDKDKGVLKEFLDRLHVVLQGKTPADGKGAVFPIYEVSEIRDSLNEAFRHLGHQIIDDKAANQITVCIISLLQSVSVDASDGEPARKLMVGITSDTVSLLGSGRTHRGHVVELPVLVAQSDFDPFPDLEGRMTLDRILSVQAINGKLVIAQQGAYA